MKVKTSVTLSEKLLRDIDEIAGPGCNRSAVLEQAAREWVGRRRREEANRHDAEIFKRLTPEQLADSDVVEYSVDPLDFGDDVELLPSVEAKLAAESHRATR